MADDHSELSEKQRSEPPFVRVQKETVHQQDVYIPSGIQFILGMISSVSLLLGGGWLLLTMGNDNGALLYLLVATGTLLPVVLSGKRLRFWIGFGIGFLLSSGLIALAIYLFLSSDHPTLSG